MPRPAKTLLPRQVASTGIGSRCYEVVERGAYTPGVLAAPILLALALYLAFELRRGQRAAERVA